MIMNSSLYAGSRSHLLKASGTRFTTPGIWFARILNSYCAAISSTSLRQAARNAFLHLAVFKTSTDTSLSHCTTILIPFQYFPQTLVATMTVRSSNAFILRFWSNMNFGKVVWKYSRFSWNQAPQPVKQASQANTSSGKDQWSTAISDIPLYLDKNSFHHRMSALTLSVTGKRPLSGKPLMNSRILDRNNLPGRTQLARNWSLPTTDWISLRDISFAFNHWSNRVNVSWTRWIGTELSSWYRIVFPGKPFVRSGCALSE